MDSVHDLGGMAGFGPVAPEPDEPVFHHRWEQRALGLTMSSFGIGLSNGGEFRHSIERMDPAHYLATRYYEHWVTGVATRAVEAGLVSQEELEERAGGAFPLSRPVVALRIDDPGANRDTPRFAPGDAVRVRLWHPFGHTRCPRYIRGKSGVVARVHPASSVPDVEAHSDGRRAEHSYDIRFDAADVWGEPAEGCIHVDLWESYLT